MKSNVWKRSWSVVLGVGVAWSAMGLSAGGCSSSTSTTTPGDGGGSDGKALADGSNSDSGDDAGACPGAPPTKADLDSQGGWKPPPAVNPSACSAADIATFKTNFNGNGSWADTVAGLPAGCASCILSKESDATWGPVVETDATGATGFVNFGACYAAKSGAQACGKAVQYSEFCINASCGDCADADFSACTSDQATLDACDAIYASDVSSGCPQATATELDALCGDIISAATYLCSTGPADGGGG